MSDELESKLRTTLRPVAPSAAFSARLLARLEEERAAPRRDTSRSWMAVGVAACLLLSVGIEQRVHAVRQRNSGLEARREVIEALRLTSQKLNLALEAVKSDSTAVSDEKSGV